MAKVQNRPFSQMVDGFQIPGMFSADIFRSVVRYKPRLGDVFIVTYPKCGTTWSQHIVSLILQKGQRLENIFDFFSAAPFLEIVGLEAVEDLPRPLGLKIHLPFQLTPYSPEAKYIYVARNPKDCCVSYYHHTKNMKGHKFEGSFDEFFELFIHGEVDYGDYFDHLLGWYSHRHDDNVLFITYEQMKADIRSCVVQMARFIGEEYAVAMETDHEILDNVIRYSSFDYMKEIVNESMDALMSMKKEDVLANPEIPKHLKEVLLKSESEDEAEKHEAKKINFLRKGIIGDWKNHFSAEQNRRLDEKFVERTKGTDIPDLWRDAI